MRQKSDGRLISLVVVVVAVTETLELYDNQLTGELPVSIGQLTNLRSLHLDGNQLSGSITRPLKPLSQLGECKKETCFWPCFVVPD